MLARIHAHTACTCAAPGTILPSSAQARANSCSTSQYRLAMTYGITSGATVARGDALRARISNPRLDIDCGEIAHAEATRANVDPQKAVGAARVVELFHGHVGLRRDRLAADALTRYARHGDIENEQRLCGNVVLQLTVDMERFPDCAASFAYFARSLARFCNRSARSSACSSSVAVISSSIFRVVGSNEEKWAIFSR